MNLTGNNSLTLTGTATCLVDIKQCTNGMTLAFWVKVLQGQVARFPNFLSSRIVKIYVIKRNTAFKPRFLVGESATKMYQSSKKIPYDQWHLVAVAYSDTSDPEFYLNGCPLAVEPRLESNSHVGGNMIVGCNKKYRNCMRGNLDDLRFWTSRKDKHFMWMLWSS